MFTELNRVLARNYKRTLENRGIPKEVIRQQVYDFVAYISSYENRLWKEMYTTRRANGVVELVHKFCKASGHRPVLIMPYKDKERCYLYHVIAYREFSNTYTVWTFNSFTGSIEATNSSWAYDNTIEQACAKVELNIWY